jgi:hypothetical protein
MFGNIFFGTLIDKCGQPILFSMLGNTLFLLAFVFIGPLAFVDVEPSKQLIQVRLNKLIYKKGSIPTVKIQYNVRKYFNVLIASR